MSKNLQVSQSGTDVRYTYVGTAHGLLEIRSQGQLPAPDGVGQETIHSVILLDPRTHMLASSVSTQTYVRAKHGGTSPVAVPERSTLTMTWRRVR